MRPLTIEGNDAVFELAPQIIQDERGVLTKTYDQNELLSGQVSFQLVEEQQWFFAEIGTLRGLHFQLEPYAQAKLIRALRGSVLNVAVDIRKESATYGSHVVAATSAKDGRQLLIPRGFAHGLCTLEPDTEILFKADAPSVNDHVRGILWNDPDLGIEWPVDDDKVIVSERDRQLPCLKDADTKFGSDHLPPWMACDDYPTFAYLLAQKK